MATTWSFLADTDCKGTTVLLSCLGGYKERQRRVSYTSLTPLEDPLPGKSSYVQLRLLSPNYSTSFT